MPVERPSKRLNSVESGGRSQKVIEFSRPPVPINFDDLKRTSSLEQAIVRCAGYCGASDQAIAIDTGIDPATWSKMKQGTAGVTGKSLKRIMGVCGNEFPLLWLNYDNGWDPRSMRRLESDLERENRELRERLAKRDEEYETIVRFVQVTHSSPNR